MFKKKVFLFSADKVYCRCVCSSLWFVRDVPPFFEQRYANSPVQEVRVMKWKVPKKSGMFLHVTSPFGGSGGVYSVRQALAELQSDDVCFSLFLL